MSVPVPQSRSEAIFPILKFLFGIFAFVAFGVWVWMLVEICGSPNLRAQETFGYTTAIVALLLFCGLIHLFEATLKGLYVGDDNRVSTSKVQVLLWTFAIGGVLLASVAQSWAGTSKALEGIPGSFEEFGPYLVLLGGPFLAAVAARGLVGTQIAENKTAKTEGQPKAKQVFTDDEGNTDLVDTQYLLFNLIAIAYFIGAFVGDPQGGFPAIPTLIYILTGASALGYVTNKTIPSGGPEIKSVSPSTAAVEAPVTVIGTNLLFPRNPTGPSEGRAAFLPFEILIDGYKAKPDAEPASVKSEEGADRILVKVPRKARPGSKVDVVAINSQGQKSDPVTIKVTAA